MIADIIVTPAERPKTVMRYFFPVWAMAWGLVMCLTGSDIYDASPTLYKSMSVMPQYIWGIMSCIIGIGCTIAEQINSAFAKIFWSIIYCTFIFVLAGLFIGNSIMGSTFWCTLTVFKFAQMAELTIRIKRAQL